jgi:Ricin-type beta-trefoil lectin domain-like
MKTRTRPRGLVVAVAAAMLAALAIPLLQPGAAHAAETLSVNLAATTGSATSVGEGFLYGVSQDGTAPPDQFIQPLGVTALRAGGHATPTGGWIADGYTYGTSTKAQVAEVIAQAKRFTAGSYHAQYQVLLTDIYGADGSQPSNTTWPCTGGNCANYVTFLDDVVGAIQASGVTVTYDIWNEPDESAFWAPGANTTQYYEMWDTAYNTIKSLAPSALTVGPDFAADPAQNPTEWSAFFAHVKSAGTAPSEISDHLEGDGDDPVAVAQSVNSDMSAAGVSARPLSANEFLPEDQQTAGQTAWYLARFAQSGYTNAARGNWASCCVNPYLAGTIVANGSGGYSYTGQWWAFRTYADLTGSKVSTSGEVGTTAVSAAEDSSKRRAVAVIGDENGYTGAASVTFSGLSSVSWLANAGNVHVTVYRIPDSSPLNSPLVVTSEIESTSSGSITVPITFVSSHDAFAVYLTPGFSAGFSSTLVNKGSSLCMDENDWTTVAAAQSQQYACNGGTNQGYTFVPVSSGSSTYFIQSMTPDDCLDVSGASTASGAAIDQWPCNYATNEQFTLHAVSTGVYQVEAVNSGLCVAPSGDSTASAAVLVQVSCTTAATRTWGISGA